MNPRGRGRKDEVGLRKRGHVCLETGSGKGHVWAKLHSSSVGVDCGNNQKYLGATSEWLSS